MLKSVNLRSAIPILRGERLHLEAKIVLLAPRHRHVVVGAPVLGLEVVQVGRVVSVAGQLAFRAADELGLLSHFEVESSAALALFVGVTGLFVTVAHEVGGGGFVGLRRASKLKLASICAL